MASRPRLRAKAILLSSLLLGAMTLPTHADVAKEKAKTMHAKGTFEVKIVPLTLDNKEAAKTMGRMSINKTFAGDLAADSKGEMLSAMTEIQGSAGYVAIERVTGKLNGKAGSFVLQHSGTMKRGTPHLSITVVPDSGTEELTGLEGTVTIKIEGKKHFYEFEYTLPQK